MNYRLHYLALPVLWILMMFSWSVSYGQYEIGAVDPQYMDANCDLVLDLTTNQNMLVDFPKITLDNPGDAIISISITSITSATATTTYVAPNLTIQKSGLVEDIVDVRFDFTVIEGGIPVDYSASVAYYVYDTIAPTFTNPPANITYDCLSEVPTASNNFYAGATAVVVTDNCTVPGTINVVYEQTPATLPDQCTGGMITREWIATDEYGNKDTYTQIITLNPDVTKPDIPTKVLPAVGPICSVNSEIPLTTIIELESALSTDIIDACADDADLIVSHKDVSNGNSCPAIWTRTYTIEDPCGNKEFVTQEITVDDTVDPVATATSIADGMSDCMTGTMTAKEQFIAWIDNVKNNPTDYVTDNCDLTVTVFDGVTDITADPTVVISNGCPDGTYPVKFVFSDACGHFVEKSASYTIADDTNPDITSPAVDKVIQTCDENVIQTELSAWLNSYAGAGATDFCSGVTSVTFKVGGNVVDINGVMAELMASFGVCENPAMIGSVSYQNVTARVDVQFTFTDACNKFSTSDATFAIQDLTDPIFSTMPQDMTVECGPDNATELATWLANNGNGSASDACTDVMWNNSVTSTSANDPCGNSSIATATFVITDNCGNTNTATAKFIVEDTTPPVVDQAPSNVTFECDGSGNTVDIMNWLTNFGGASATDCSLFDWTNDFVDLTDGCGKTGSRVVTFTATDDCGNTNNVTATVTIEDTTDPVITTSASDMIVECDGAGNTTDIQTWLDNQAGATASDGCGDIKWSNNFTALSNDCGMTGNATVIFTATDECGNSATTSAVFTIEDTTSPTLNMTATGKVVECDGAGNTDELAAWVANHGGAQTDQDICGSIIWNETEDSNVAGACGNEKDITYTFTAIDACGNSISTTAVFQIKDTKGAVFFDVPEDMTINCGETVPSGMQGVTAIDVCGGDITTNISTAQIYVNDGCPTAPTGTFTNSWSVTDACGNVSTALQVITVIDNTSPIIDGATDKSVPCDDAGLDAILQTWITDHAGASAVDECSNSTWSYTYETNDDPAQTGSTGSYPVVTPGKCDWVVTVTFIATDDCGNESTSPAEFSLTDVVAPVFLTFPTDKTITADAICDFDITTATNGMPTVSDNCDVNVSLDYVDSDDIKNPCTDFTMNQITRTWTVSDACGNSTVQDQILTLKDVTPPTFTVPMNITVDCDLGIDPSVTGKVDITADNCDLDVVNGYEDTEALTVCGGMVTRLWTVSDACGNTSTGTQIITVVDNTDPVITATTTMDYNCSTATLGMNAAFTAWIDNHAGATATDNCTPTDDITWVAYDHGTTNPAALPTGMCPGDISQDVDFIVTDACGNSAMVTETFKVTDDTAPEFINCLEDVTITTSSDGLGDCAANYSFIPPIIKDDCGVDLSPCSPAYIPGSGFVTVTSSSPGDPNVLVDPVNVTFVVSGPPTTATGLVTIQLDLYNVDGEANDPTSKEYFNIIGEDGSVLGVTNKPQNQCGNASTTITVDRTTFNNWAIDGLIEITLDPFNPGPGLEFQGINDICGATTVGGSITYDCSQITNLTLEYSLDGGTTRTLVPNPIASSITENFPIGTNTLTFIATDCSGNENTCSFDVTVQDDEPPVIANCTLSSVPATLATTDCNPVDLELPRPGGISDNCYVNSYDQTVDAGLVTFTEHPNIDGYVIDTMRITFPMTIPPPATGLATLTVNFKGDIDNTSIGGNQARELFEIIGEDGVSLGQTIAGPGCDPNMSVISVAYITMDKLIDWSADGQIDLTIYPSNNNTFFGNDGDWLNDDYGVNPCGGAVDIISGNTVSDFGNTKMSMRLEYTATPVYYSLKGATTIAPTVFPINGTNPTVSINPGPNIITYYVADVYGNVDSTCTTTVTVGSPSLGTPVIGAITTNSCIGELDILTETSNYVGTNPKWLWYEDIAPFGMNDGEDVLLETTQIPFKSYEVTGDIQKIYVIIQDNLCVSDNSAVVSIPAGINVIQPAIYINPNPICSGSDFGLYVANPQLDWVSYSWSGPNGYMASGQTPAGVTNASPINSGEYFLTVVNTNGCELIANTFVEVKGTSSATVASISYDSGGTGPCVSGTDDLTFAISETPVDVNDSYTYIWSGPNGYSSTEKNAKVLNVTTADNGQYCVTVFDETGCPSAQKCIIVDVKDIPTTPTLTVAGDMTELCEGESVTINTTSYSGSTNIVYYWSTPLGLISTSTPSLIIDPVGANNAGAYSVFVSIDGCDSELSNEVNVTVKPRPAKPTITGTSPICSGDSLILETPAIQGASYEWSGPGLTASVNKVVIYPATTINAGDYSVRVSLDGCPSDFSEIFTVTIDPTPATPMASVSGNVCLDDNNATLTLQVDNVTTGATYEWFNADGNVSIGTTNQAEYTITNLNVFTEGVYNFYVVATMSTGCSSAISNIVSIEMSNIPNISAFAGDDINVCGDASVNLNADMPTQGTGTWSQVSGPTATIADVNSPTSTVNGLLANSEYEFKWTLSNGACTDFSSDNVTVVVNNNDGVAEAGMNQDLCDVTSATLTATPAPAGSTGTWSQSTTQSALGGIILNPSSPTTEVTGLVSGNEYIFTWTLSNKGCGDYSTHSVTITVFGKVNASLSQDVNMCGDVTVSANSPGDCTGSWSSTNGDIVFANPTAQVTAVTGLSVGENILRWTITCGNCGETFDEMIVSYEENTEANDDVAIVDFVNSTSIDVGANDQFYAGATFSIVSSVSQGTLTNEGDGIFSYLPNVSTTGADEFTYEVCSVNCPNECAQAKVTIAVSIDTDCSIPTIITPNGDGYNDEFLIACLKATSKYPNNKVTIFNEWGDQVFEASPYNNDWKGTYNGQELPVGTYFYIVDFGDGSDPQSGFLLIER